jgi:hypothetical protein
MSKKGLILLSLCITYVSGAELFRPARFRGLIVGSTRRSAFEVILGRPDQVTVIHGRSEHVYLNPSPSILKLTLSVRNRDNIVEAVFELPRDRSLTALRSRFGHGYHTRRYSFDLCFENDDDGLPIFESPDGPFYYVVYPRLGVWAQLRDNRREIEEVAYSSFPPGPSKSQCRPAVTKAK